MDISSISLENAHLFLQAFEDQTKPKEEAEEYKADECQECHGKLIYMNFFIWVNVTPDMFFLCLDNLRKKSRWKMSTPNLDLEARVLYLEQIIKDLTGLST